MNSSLHSLEKAIIQDINPKLFLPKNLCDEIASKITLFRKRKETWITSHCQHIQEGDVHYYGIHKNEQMCPSGNLSTRHLYQEMKSKVLEIMGFPPDTQVIQVVGDSSAAFSQEGTRRAMEFLREQLTENCLVSYGYTGLTVSDGTRCVNAAVSDVILEKNMQKKVVANLVGFHTQAALKEWGNSGPSLHHYVIVYGDDETSRETGTVFGDDVITSDFFADSLLVLDGGAQSFRQACNALLLDQKITVLSGLRTPERSYLKQEVVTPYFVTANFLKEVAQLILENKDIISESFLNEWYQNHFGIGKCYVGNPKNPNFDTKQKLLDDAWNLFIEEKLYRKMESSVAFKS